MLRWMYLFMCTLVLVNLLIAQMAETYGNVMAEGIMRWKYNRATLISEYKVPLTLARALTLALTLSLALTLHLTLYLPPNQDPKPPLPPPFNLVCFAYNGVARVIERYRQSGVTTASTVGFKKVPSHMDLGTYPYPYPYPYP